MTVCSCSSVFDTFYQIKGRSFLENIEILRTQYVYELYAAGAFVLFVIVYMKGAAKNETIANKWLDANLKTFQNQFESVGIKNEAGMKQMLEQESKSQWKFFATGRNNCAYVMVNLETKKRHDLIAMTGMNIVWPQYDRIQYEVPLLFDSPPSVCFALFRKKDKNLLNDNADIKNLCKKYNVKDLTPSYMVYAENEEIIESIFDPQLKKFLNDNPKAVELIHITDMKTFLNSELALKMNFILPDQGNMALTTAMSQLTLKFIDKLRAFRPSQKAKDASAKNRMGYEAVVAKDDTEKEEENREKLRVAKEEKWNSLSKEQKKRAQELEEKRQRQKMVKKFKVR